MPQGLFYGGIMTNEWSVDICNQEVLASHAEGSQTWNFPSRQVRRSVKKYEHVTIEVWAAQGMEQSNHRYRIEVEVETQYMKGDHVEYLCRIIKHKDSPQSLELAMPPGSIVTIHDDHIREVLAPSLIDDSAQRPKVKTIATVQYYGAGSLSTALEDQGGSIIFCGAQPLLAVPEGSSIDPGVIATLINQLFGPFELKQPKSQEDFS